jgi:hypothetical protein
VRRSRKMTSSAPERARVAVLLWHLFSWRRRLVFPILPLSAGPSAFAVLAVLLQVVLNSAEAAPPSPLHVVRNVGEILVRVEKNEDKSDRGLIEVETIRANLAKLLTELLEDRSADPSIRQDQSTGVFFSPTIQLDPRTLVMIVRVTVHHALADGSSLGNCLRAVAIGLERDRPEYGYEEDEYRLGFAPEPFISRCDAAAVSAQALQSAEPLVKLIADVIIPARARPRRAPGQENHDG